MAFSIPRVRTHHTKEPSRFAYALVPRPHIKGVAGVYELCALTEEKACSLPYIGMAQSKVEQTTRAFEPALLPLPAVGRFT